MKTKKLTLILASALCCAALLADEPTPDPIAIEPPPPAPVRISVQLTPEQTAALLESLAPSFQLPEGIVPEMIQSIAAHRTDPASGASLDLVFDVTWPAPETE